MITVKLLFKGHFHINVVDKVVLNAEVGGIPFRKLPLTILVLTAISFPLLGPLRDNNCPNTITLLDQMESSEFIFPPSPRL